MHIIKPIYILNTEVNITFYTYKEYNKMIDLEKTSLGRKAKTITLKDALNTLTEHITDNLSKDENRSVTHKEVELMIAMMRVNSFIREMK